MTHGENGLPTESSGGRARGLITMIGDAAARRRMARQALECAVRFQPRSVAQKYERLFATLLHERTEPLHADCWAEMRGEVNVRSRESECPLRGAGRPARNSASGSLRAFPPTRENPVAVLGAGPQALPAGAWELHLESPDGSRQRVRADQLDVSALMPAAGARAERPTLRVAVPYVTDAGNLNLRMWLRDVHAESGRVVTSGGLIEVTADLWGCTTAVGSTLVARSRQDRAGAGCAPSAAHTTNWLLMRWTWRTETRSSQVRVGDEGARRDPRGG